MPDNTVRRLWTKAADRPSHRGGTLKMAALIALCAIVAACTPPSPDTAAGLPHEFDLNCSAHWAHENPSFPPLPSLPEQHYHIDLAKGLVNYAIPLSANPIQLAWTPDHDGYMYQITINRLTGALYEMQLFPSGLRTGYDISGTCELAPPPPPQPKF